MFRSILTPPRPGRPCGSSGHGSVPWPVVGCELLAGFRAGFMSGWAKASGAKPAQSSFFLFFFLVFSTVGGTDCCVSSSMRSPWNSCVELHGSD
jgi:hypothetical protein